MSDREVYRLLFYSLPPLEMVRLRAVCRDWRDRLSSNCFWYRHRASVLHQLPMLSSLFYEGEPIWRTFCKRLWLLWNRCPHQIQHYPTLIKEAVVFAAHRDASVIDRVFFWTTGKEDCNYGAVTYRGGTTARVDFKIEQRKEEALAAKWFEIPGCSSKGEVLIWKIALTSSSTPLRFAAHPLQCLFGPYMDVVLCRPKMFRDQHGRAVSADGHCFEEWLVKK